MIYPIILAGGVGSRLWPMSRKLYPKQFLNLPAEQPTLLQSTLLRLKGIDVQTPIIICNEEHRFLVAEQLRQLEFGQTQIVLEPVGRNTAPAIALGALQAMRIAEELGDDALLLVLAADHWIQNVNEFHRAIGLAACVAQSGALVTFGIEPTRAETGYGYIEVGEKKSNGVFSIKAFVEKPDEAAAQRYLSSGGFLWNSGMFMFSARAYLDALRRYEPGLLESCELAMENSCEDMDFLRVDAQIFQRCPDISIDYAVMEKHPDTVVVPMSAGWSDVGSWASLWDVSEKNEDGNVKSGDVISISSKNNFLYSAHRLVCAVGVSDLVIVETKDAVLVASKKDVQQVKKVVEMLEHAGRKEHIYHREVYRPWGVYDSIGGGDRYQVKRITVKPGAKLSVQMHHHRAEHWVVVRGVAKVTCGERRFLVHENQSTYIPVGEVHALENPGVIPLELIEVQSGSYLGEDDIVRLLDVYGRA